MLVLHVYMDVWCLSALPQLYQIAIAVRQTIIAKDMSRLKLSCISTPLKMPVADFPNS